MLLSARVVRKAATPLAPDAVLQRRSPTAPFTALFDRDYFPRA